MFADLHYYETEHDNLLIFGKCVQTGKPYNVLVPKSGVEEWLAGAHIQDALPMLSAGQREFLLSGHSPEGWDELCPEEER